MWRIDPLLGNDRETNKEITPACRQQILDKQQLNYNRRTVFSMPPVPRRYKQVNRSNESVVGNRRPVRTLAEDIVRICCQETTSEDIEDFMCSVVTVVFRVCKPVRMLLLLVVTSCVYKWSINRVTNKNPFYSHSYT
jgi:hypothetical protein